MKVFAVIAATVAVASAQSLAVKKWTPVNFGAARGHNCLTANGEAAKLSRDCDIQASAYPKLCVSVGGQCGMSLADAEANCGAIEGCAGVFCAPYYSDATRCLARSKAEFAGKYIHRVKGVYNKIKRAPIAAAFKNVKNVATRAAKIDELREHFKLCDAQNCANWACKEWCHCFDEKAEHLGLYEHHGCDEDASSGACECETTGNGATFSVEDQMFLQKRADEEDDELMKKTTKTAWSADMKHLAPHVNTMEIAAKHKFVAAQHK